MNKKTDKPTIEAKADAQETKPAAKKTAAPATQQFQVWYGGLQLDVTAQRTEGDVTYLQCSAARQAYPEAAYPSAELESAGEVTPAAPTDDQTDPPATDPES
ncbi:hypothetical protein GCM10022631_01750 [Deinococcus rubellus]|uniref:Uncharacterized protein n=1 Tax=Deinococcus rubellus TaxID=1889240 RepID=A0ABY5YJ92_9DEIO|nr:hypothetical protein [Deinococcus rubellus]UWX64756.1 hypothetical protein N0D28_03595 [Deinococcus rubellus]